jgi:hypothetical protein
MRINRFRRALAEILPEYPMITRAGKLLALSGVLLGAGCIGYRPVTESGDSFPGLRNLVESAPAPGPATHPLVRIFMIHGMTTHPANYADDTALQIARLMHYELNPKPSDMTDRDDHPLPIQDFEETPPSIRVYRFFDAQGVQQIALYAYHWSPLTTPIKEAMFLAKDGGGHAYASPRIIDDDIKKAWGNGYLKHNVMDDGFSEAVLYVEHYHHEVMHRSLLKALKVFFTREYDLPPGSRESLGESSVAFVSASLGSTMLIDALNVYFKNYLKTHPDPAHALREATLVGASETLPKPGAPTGDAAPELAASSADVEQGTAAFGATIARTKLVFMFANQISLLELPTFDPIVYKRATKRAERRMENLQDIVSTVAQEENRQRATRDEPSLNPHDVDVVGFSDPNDLLTYRLDAPGLNAGDSPLVNVRLHNVAPHNGWDWLGLMEWPLTAHTGYPENNHVMEMVVNGLPAGAN